MKTLMLLRHAKSSHANPLKRDRDRSLNDRGRQACATIGRHLREKQLIADFAMTSSAARAIETLELVYEAAEASCPVTVEEELYLAEPAVIMAHAQGAPEEATSLMMVGHNPGFASLAFMLGGKAPLPPKLTTYPTAALAVFVFEARHWTDLDPTKARLSHFTTPKQLDGGQ